MHAVGCSGANFLVYGAHLTPGDEVLMERPGYDPMAGACRLLGTTVRFFDRPASTGFAVDVDAIRRGLTPRTRLVILDRKSTRLNSSHIPLSRMPSSA